TRSTRDWSSDVCSSDLIRLRIGDRYIAQNSYSSPLEVSLLHIFRERTDQGFDEVAQLLTPDNTEVISRFDISGARVVSATWKDEIGRASCRESVEREVS